MLGVLSCCLLVASVSCVFVVVVPENVKLIVLCVENCLGKQHLLLIVTQGR